MDVLWAVTRPLITILASLLSLSLHIKILLSIISGCFGILIFCNVFNNAVGIVHLLVNLLHGIALEDGPGPIIRTPGTPG